MQSDEWVKYINEMKKHKVSDRLTEIYCGYSICSASYTFILQLL